MPSRSLRDHSAARYSFTLRGRPTSDSTREHASERTGRASVPMTARSMSLAAWSLPEAKEPNTNAHVMPSNAASAAAILPRMPHVFTAMARSSGYSGHVGAALNSTCRPESSETRTPASSSNRSSRATVGAEKPVRLAISRTCNACPGVENRRPITASRVRPNRVTPREGRMLLGIC